MRRLAVVLIVSLAAFACAGERSEEKAAEATGQRPAPKAESKNAVEMLASPAGPGAAEPFLFAGKGGAILSWLEPVAGTDRTALRFARHSGGAWSEAKTVIERNDLFVNWADFPSIVEDANGVLFTHWLQKSGGGTYAYDVWMASSTDGVKWSEGFLLNRDGTKTEHGFVSLSPLPTGGVAAAWLDGRNMKEGDHDGHEGGGDMTLRYANVAADGKLSAEAQLDVRVCECCATGMAVGSAGPVIVYRDRSPDEIRDISWVRGGASGWSEPKPVHSDGWKIDGCPVNGPQIDAAGDRLAVAWFTAAGEKQKTWVAFSSDAGATFGAPVAVDEGRPAGRVDLVMLDRDSAVVAWLEQTNAGAEIRARRVSADGKAQPAVKIADSSMARAAGFTRMARVGDEVWFTWTEQSATDKKIHVARARF